MSWGQIRPRVECKRCSVHPVTGVESPALKRCFIESLSRRQAFIQGHIAAEEMVVSAKETPAMRKGETRETMMEGEGNMT